jgi:hypothetical protein
MALIENLDNFSLNTTPNAEELDRPDRIQVDPEVYAKQQVQGMIEHLNDFVVGEQDSFSRLFVNSDPHHSRQHRIFVKELGITAERDSSDTTVLRIGNVVLEKEVQYSADDAPFSVTYTARKDT